MDFDPDDFPEKEVKKMTLKNGEGFVLVFEKQEDLEEVRVWQKLYGETVFIMTIDRHALGSIIYALEDML